MTTGRAVGKKLLGFGLIAVAICVGGYAVVSQPRHSPDLSKAQKSAAGTVSRPSAKPVDLGVDNDVQVPFLSQWAVGADYVYSLDYATRVEVVGGNRFLDLDFGAELVVARAADRGEQLVKLQWSNIRLRNPPAEGAAAQISAFLATLSVPVVGRFKSDGELVALHAAPEIEAAAFGILGYVLAELQLQAPPDHQVSWEGDELDFLGAYTAQYRRMENRQVWRTHRRYQALHAGMSGNVERVDHTAKFTFTGDNVLSRVESRAILVSRNEVGATRGSTELRANYVKSRPGSFSSMPVGFKSFPIRPLSTSLAERPDPQQTVSVLASSLRTELGDQGPHFEAKAQLTARLRHHPDEIPQVLEAIRSALDGHESARLLQALADAGTPESARAVADLARDSKADLSLRKQAVGQLSIVEKPTADSVRELSKLAMDTEVDTQVRRAATLGVGANLHNLPEGALSDAEREATHDKLASQATSAPASADRQAAISSLGNAGLPQSLPTLQTGLDSPLPSERASAVFALRLIPGAEAEQRILAALSKDPSPLVRSSAAQALAARPTVTEQAAAALFQAMNTEADPSVQQSLLVPVPLYLPQFPELRQGLEALAARTPRAEIRQQIAELLQQLANLSAQG